jgi:phosphatidylinositol alpha-mannosyltransferase
MRIAIVCPYAWDRPGGVQSHVAALGAALRARNHNVTVIAPRLRRGMTSEDPGLRFIGRAVGVPANGSIAPIAFGPRAAAGVRRTLRSLRPDIVHLHEPLIPSLSLLALLDCPAPAVGTFHSARDESRAYSAASPILRQLVERLAVRTAVSDAARALVEQHFPGTYLLTPNGVDVDRFSAAQAEDLGSEKTVLFLGRVERRKGLEILVQAMTRLRDLQVTLVVAGDGPHGDRCRRLADRLSVRSSFLGALPEARKPGIVKAADVYCAPNLGGESFGIVLIEAMAAGVPVVCSDLPGFRSAAGTAAAFVPPGNAGLLADALRKVLTEQREAESMRAAGARSARMFDWSRLVPGVEAIYERARSSAESGQNG